VLEIGLLLDEPRFVEAAKRTARGVAEVLAADGFLAGRLDEQWRAAVDWSCVTGEAQMAIVWDRLHALEGARTDAHDGRDGASDAAPIFSMTLERWTSTVLGLRPSVVPTSLFALPWTTRSMT